MKETMPLRAAYEFGASHGLQREMNDIRDMVIEWDRLGTSSLRRAYVISLFEAKGLLDAFTRDHWPFGDTPAGSRKRDGYMRFRARYEAFLAGRDSDSGGEPDEVDDTESESESQFALEAHLRDFLARNLEKVEPGLRLYTSEASTGVEFPVDGGRIDILAVDSNKKFVVLELKLSRGRNRALGQICYYMGWVDRHLGQGPCRGIIIATDITEDLAIAVERVPGVTLAKYRMSFAIERLAT